MSYRCRICHRNEVSNEGEICDLCAISQDPFGIGVPYQTQENPRQNGVYTPPANDTHVKRGPTRKVLINGGQDLVSRDPYGNSLIPDQDSSEVQVYGAGQVPQVQQQTLAAAPVVSPAQKLATAPLTSGIIKNIMVDNQKRSFLSKWFRAVFSGIPYTFDDDVTLFQVFPDYSGSALNAQGNACDQVVIYGKVNNGAVAENNEVEVYGHRDSKNNILAKKIINKASGTTIKPGRTIPALIVRLITLSILALFVLLISGVGVEALIWAAVIVLCLTNLPLVIKIVAAIAGAVFSLIKHIFTRG